MSSNLVKNEGNRQIAHHDALATYLHDFETTIQDYISAASQLRGILNFSALWHEVIYLNDTAIGDNPHLIGSFFTSPENGLHGTLREFIKAGIVRPLFRNKIAIRDIVLVEDRPTLSEIFAGWRMRDQNSPDKFLMKEFGSERDRYNKYIDHLLFHDVPNAIVWYDPDYVKPLFRERVRQQVSNSDSQLRQLINKLLPPEKQFKYLETCNNDAHFTNADLWNLLRGVDGVKDLVVAQGHINQQCYADYVLAGMTGSDFSGLQLAKFNWNSNVGTNYNVQVKPPKSLDEIFDQAIVTLQAPALEVLGLLTPEQIFQLREEAKKTIFKLAHFETGQISLDKFRILYLDAITNYWNHVCEFLEREYPKHTKRKRRLGIFSYGELPTIPPAIRKGVIYISLHTALRYVVQQYVLPDIMPNGELIVDAVEGAVSGGLAAALNSALGTLGYHILLEDTPEMIELREKLPPEAWRVRGVWATNQWKK